jgi:uncharacterized membrane protein YccC
MSSSWRPLIRAALHVDVDRIELGGTVRCTIGVVIPLAVGLATGAVGDGVAAAVGALCAGFASFQGSYRSRAWLTLAVAAGMAVSTVVGVLASRHGVSAVLVTAAFGLMAGMLGSLGQGALITGMQWVVAELIVGVIPMTLSQAVVRAAAIMAGGVLQTLLVVVLWPFGTYVVERRSLQAAYSDLARYAEEVTDGMDLGHGAATINDARAALGDPQPFSNASRLLAFQALIDEAERIRIEIAAVARHRSRLSQPSAAGLERLIATAAVVLRCVARGLARDEVPRVPAEALTGLAVGCDQLRNALTAHGEPPWLASEVGRASGALAGQLRSVVRLAAVSAGRSDPMLVGRDLPMRHHLVVRDSLDTLRANVSLQSTSLRHSVRLGVTLGVAMLIYRATGLAHGYWIPLTALVVLRPDYASTALRGISRVAGTIVGAGVATLVAALIRPDQIGLAILFAVASFAAFLLLRANYAAFSVAVTSYVVFLLAFVKLPAIATVGDRLLDTLLGGALAIVAYLVWPTWESRLIGPQLAQLLDAQTDYMTAVMAVWIDPPALRAPLGELRSTTRLARSNAEASVDRLVAEPPRSLRSGLIDPDQVRGIVAAAGSVSLAILSLHLQLPPEDAPPCSEAQLLARGLEDRGRALAAQLRSRGGYGGDTASTDRARQPEAADEQGDGPRAVTPVSLRELHTEMADRLQSRTNGMDDVGALLIEETDLLVDSLNTISDLLDPRPSKVA